MCLIVEPQVSGRWQHNYSTKLKHAGPANEQSMYYLMSMVVAPVKPLVNSF
jgi:hypothetical protein